ncbi:MAG: alpha-ketoacid dehydrogenase subunit beta [Acidimicrobiales bacterium]|nr:alpha-ketoacid dehydrogenase subunit beta [Acidimicrobiales bacterium]
MAELNMLQAINESLHFEMARDERVVVLGEDVGHVGGVFRATEGLYEKFGEQRVTDMPLAEGVIAGSAVGLAMAGLVPVIEMQFLGFSLQAMHQIGGQIARLRNRYQGRFSSSITIRSPFGGGVRTPELHSDSLEALFANIPGLKVVLPATAADAKGLLASAIRDPDPVLFLEPLRGYRGIKDEVPDGEYLVPLGKARVAREGTDVVIIAWSHQVSLACRSADRLAEEGVSVQVLDLRSLVPLDLEAIGDAVRACGRVVVTQEAPTTAGFAAEVIATINEECFYSLEAPVERVTGYDVPYPVGLLEDIYVPDEARITAAVRKVLAA